MILCILRKLYLFQGRSIRRHVGKNPMSSKKTCVEKEDFKFLEKDLYSQSQEDSWKACTCPWHVAVIVARWPQCYVVRVWHCGAVVPLTMAVPAEDVDIEIQKVPYAMILYVSLCYLVCLKYAILFLTISAHEPFAEMRKKIIERTLKGPAAVVLKKKY